MIRLHDAYFCDDCQVISAQDECDQCASRMVYRIARWLNRPATLPQLTGIDREALRDLGVQA